MARILKAAAILAIAGLVQGACANGAGEATRDYAPDVKVRWAVGVFR